MDDCGASHRVVSGSDVATLFGPLTSWFAGDTLLGVDQLDRRPPLATQAPVVSNHGMNGIGGTGLAQIESDFVVAPGPTFTLTVVLPPGELTLAAQTSSALGLPIVDILAVRSERATVLQTPTGISASVPLPGDVAWSEASATASDFARIDIDVAVRRGTEDAPGVIFDSWFCAIVDSSGQCVVGTAMNRAFPLSR